MNPFTDTDRRTFTDAYIEALLWANLYDLEGGDPVEENAPSSDDIDFDTARQITLDCEAFITDNAELLADERITPEQAGHDFALTRNHHGAGFWDRGNGELGEQLTEACRPYGEYNLCLYADGSVTGQ
jgi:hypothetical protein